VIDLAELGDVHIGKNITDYAWDGTDEFGDKLANGVYLYRVATKTDNKLEDGVYDNGADKGNKNLFKNGWGKMYLMR
jgi:flagellar hook assembly protein FlgD